VKYYGGPKDKISMEIHYTSNVRMSSVFNTR